jgi:hypothetical protein
MNQISQSEFAISLQDQRNTVSKFQKSMRKSFERLFENWVEAKQSVWSFLHCRTDFVSFMVDWKEN